MASGGIALRSAKAMKLIEKVNEERDDAGAALVGKQR
jgi:hypothetical protein